ncbi:MAG: riboflavin synthase [Chloroflexi bacterium]|nr:riboflavin synthase [Chloroflexota bacterium]|tara:strand:+ start:1560 stop:2159 length:600 start_codon:yes stop_codon:yes gene_type:complete
MFSGIIETTGKITTKSNNSISVVCKNKDLFNDLKKSDSILVDGICLTIVNVSKKSNDFTLEIIPETLSRTNLKDIKINSEVNLERSVKYGDRIGGHLVQGHIDGIGKINKISSIKNSKIINIETTENIIKFCVLKGYIAINGISLTLTKISPNNSSVEVAIIPYTYKNTNIKNLILGSIVNIEVDITGKYIKKFVSGYI